MSKPDPLHELALHLANVLHSPLSISELETRLAADPRFLATELERAAVGERPERRFLLVVDPLEKLFTASRDDGGAKRRQQWIAALRHLATQIDPRLRVLAVLRADFMEPALRQLSELVAPESQVALGPMRDPDLRAAITKPAEQVGLALEAGLEELLVQAVQGEPGHLALLEFVLDELWKRREGRYLKLAEYHRLGDPSHGGSSGPRAALARRADEELERLAQRGLGDVARRIFVQLVQPGQDAPDTRRSVGMRELQTLHPDLSAALDALIEARLVTTREEHVEIAHEALIREWPRLRTWIDEDRETLQLQHDLQRSARTWDEAERPPTDLWRGHRLERALELRRVRSLLLAKRETEFLDQSELEVRRSRRTRTRWVAGAAATLIAAVIVLAGISIYALDAAQRTRDLARTATARQYLALDPTLATLVLREIERPERTPSTEQTLHDVLAARTSRDIFTGHDGAIAFVEFSPNGDRILTASIDGTTRVWSVDRTSPPVVLRGHTGPSLTASFSRDGKRIVTASQDGTARIWNADGSGESIVLRGHQKGLGMARFSPDGAWILTAADDDMARIWRADGTGKPIVLPNPGGWGYNASFSPDGRHVLLESQSGEIRVWNADGTGPPVVLDASQQDTMMSESAKFSPRGERIAKGAKDGTLRVWRTDGSGDPVVLRGHTALVHAVAFSPQGDQIASVSDDGTARVWNAEGSGKPSILRGYKGGGDASVAFDRAGSAVAASSSDGTVQLWALDGSEGFIELRGHTGSTRIVFSPTERLLATGAADGTLRVWRIAQRLEPIFSVPRTEGALIRPLVAADQVAAFSPDGDHLLSRSSDGKARIWTLDESADPLILRRDRDRPEATGQDGERVATPTLASYLRTAVFDPTGKRVLIIEDPRDVPVALNADGRGEPIELRGHEGTVEYATFSRDGSRIVTASSDRTARIWNADGSGEPIVLRGHEGSVESARFSNDGSRIVTASVDGTARIWNARTGEPQSTLSVPERQLDGAAFSPDGRRVATRLIGPGIALWDAQDGKLLHVTPQRGYAAPAFSPDGERIAMADNIYAVRVERTDGTGEPVLLKVRSIRGTPGQQMSVSWISFSPDGLKVVAAYSDGAARIWNADGSSSAPIVLEHHDSELTRFGGVAFATFGPKGNRILTVGKDTSVHVWTYDIPTLRTKVDKLVPHLCLSSEARRDILEENLEQARQLYVACERGLLRTEPPVRSAIRRLLREDQLARLATLGGLRTFDLETMKRLGQRKFIEEFVAWSAEYTRNETTRQIARMSTTSLDGTPEPFRTAYTAHIAAWKTMMERRLALSSELLAVIQAPIVDIERGGPLWQALFTDMDTPDPLVASTYQDVLRIAREEGVDTQLFE